MAISINFNAAVIYKPGAYSKTTIDLGGNFPLGATGIVGIIGEATAGPSGLFGPFTADQMSDLQSTYISGNVVDAARFLFSPSLDAAIPSGANAIFIYKTNASAVATLGLSNNDGTIFSINTGTYGNAISFDNAVAAESVAIAQAVPAVTFDLQVAGDMDDKQFSISVNGGAKNTFTCPGGGTVNTRALLTAALSSASNWSLLSVPAEIDWASSVGGASDSAATLSIRMEANANANRLGYGRNFVLEAGLNDALVVAGINPGQYVAVSEPTFAAELQDNNVNPLLVYPAGGAVVQGGQIALEIGYYDASGPTSASVSIDATNMTLTVVGGANAVAASKVIPLSGYATLSQIVTAINLTKGPGAIPTWKWQARIPSTTFNALNPSSLDRVSSLGALAENNQYTARIKRDAKLFRDFMSVCPFAGLTAGSSSFVGFPDAQQGLLSGGQLGGSSNASFADGLDKLTKMRLNSVVPLFSRDAAEDIADNLTDASSTYQIDAIHALMKTHLAFTAATKKRSERQGYLSFKGSYLDSKSKAAAMGEGRIQMMIQDCKQVDSQGSLRWFQPWATACFLAGGRAGSIVGTPMTFKFLNVTGIRHSADPMTVPEGSVSTDFDPDIQYDDAIQSGITFLEAPQTGGFRIVVDNTTYGRDGNWVLNRANVLYTADVVAYDFRNKMEQLYVGKKNTITTSEVSSTASSILAGYLAQGLLVNPGFRDLSVRIVGNEIRISATLILVEGIDFVLTEFVVTRAVSQ